jgi:RHS repeat-associated protein
MRYDGADYVYLKNLQGDVVGIVNTSGALVAEYGYDAWGNVTSISGNAGLAAANPFRYRGYYWDSETSLYYCQSRYYDSAVGRWISADNPLLFDTLRAVNEVLGCNLFVYCSNNSVNKIDVTGMLAAEAAIYVIGSTPGVNVVAAIVSGILLGIAIIAIAALVIAITYILWQVLLNIVNKVVMITTVAVAIAKSAISDLTGELSRIKIKAINKAAKAVLKYGKATHHIVAKTARGADPARRILRDHGIGLDSNANLVLIPAVFHFFVHSTVYYNAVNNIISRANDRRKSPAQRTANIYAQLAMIKAVFVAITNSIDAL